VIVGAGVLAEDDPMNLQGTDSLFAHQHQVSNLEPEFQGLFGILENGLRDNREAVTVLATAILGLTDPSETDAPSERKRCRCSAGNAHH
jgi:hypothetical protein